ncbi:hypothetical protein F511_26162 [Dorcoceras hygrometricum]|uniref:LysM domain-containing protein n=1 Tax=Dorcoceras hygrometricum TaxID=472368 RepID=A0A2Z7A4L5_9LAMI|nr:hypothetical protein F511_26162 [Dorcoceras hygrometricum]
MAKASNNTSIILNFALVLSLILITTIAESRVTISAKSKASVTLVCNSVTAVNKGDTCFDIAKSFNLTTAEFHAINPNVNCDALFVGQWLCIDGFEF